MEVEGDVVPDNSGGNDEVSYSRDADTGETLDVLKNYTDSR